VPTIEAAVEELWGQSPNLLIRLPKGTKGLLFRQVFNNGISAKAGIKNEDIMLSANDKTYERIEPFLEFVRAQEIGSKIKFLVCSANGKNKREISLMLTGL
jgi:S1-C subfamily serine protease